MDSIKQNLVDAKEDLTCFFIFFFNISEPFLLRKTITLLPSWPISLNVMRFDCDMCLVVMMEFVRSPCVGV